MDLALLPRTIQLVRAGASYDELNEKAAAETAAFVCAGNIAQGAPIAVMLDQSALPYSERYLCTCDWRRVVDAIKRLEVRGAPAIGIAGSIAVALCSAEISSAHSTAGATEADLQLPHAAGAMSGSGASTSDYAEALHRACAIIIAARPTAVNLRWAVHRAADVADDAIRQGATPEDISDLLYSLVQEMITEDESANRRIGEYGAALLPDDASLLTHCNAGSLATAFYGTALGVVYAAAAKGGVKRVFADETRPVGQGARLTVWELSRAGIPVTLICDDMSASVMASGAVDAVIVGADRVAANGDVANKIGTLGVAIIARRFGIPFYVACPLSTVDPATLTGDDITIEQRSPSEVLERPIDGVDILNPAFDVTPSELITAIITDAGVFEPGDILNALES